MSKVHWIKITWILQILSQYNIVNHLRSLGLLELEQMNYAYTILSKSENAPLQYFIFVTKYQTKSIN